MTKNLSKIWDSRIDIVFLFDVVLGNPNGDPDAANLPRVDEETELGLVTDVCTKRKLRNMMPTLSEGKKGFNIYITSDDADDDDRILNKKHEKAYKETGANGSNAVATARQFMCDEFIDVRAFGAVMSTTGKSAKKSESDDSKESKESNDKYNAGKVTGPIQLSFARSIDPIVPMDLSITRKCVASEKDAEEQIKKHRSITGTMGRKTLINYGLYRQMMWYNPFLAQKTGFSVADLKVLLKALTHCFGQHRTASSGQQSFRGAYVFIHGEPLGVAHDYELFDAIEITKNKEIPRSFQDYDVIVHKDRIPKGVVLHEIMKSTDVDKLIKELK